MSNADLLLHPVRLRVVQTLLGGRELTTGQLRELLPDLPPASLYRQMAVLLEGQVIELVSERRARGSVERTYRLNLANSVIDADVAASMDADSHRRAFRTFVASLLGDFDRYLTRGAIDLARDGVGYRQLALHLSDAELAELVADLNAVLERRLDLQPAPERARRLLSTILMPAA